MIKVFTDGGSRGNPGPAAFGVHIENENGTTLAEIGKYIGTNTNNVAEYTAVIEAFNWLLAHHDVIQQSAEVQFFMDSELVCRQLNGMYKVKHPMMQQLFYTIQGKQQQLPVKVTFTHIPREKNKKADAMVNKALDAIGIIDN